MKKLLTWCILFILMFACTTSKRALNKAIGDAILDQNEIVVFQRLGIPYQTILREDGRKVWIYRKQEHLLSSPNNSWHASTHAEQLAVRKNRTFKSSKEDIIIRTPDKTAAIELNNDKTYTSSNPFLRIYFDRHGKCVSFEQNMTPEQMKIYHERLIKSAQN